MCNTMMKTPGDSLGQVGRVGETANGRGGEAALQDRQAVAG
jgi:hypothetical protein